MSVQYDMEEKTIENDKDLVQLAGYYAYQEQTEGNELEVLGKKFRVEHVEKSSSGMEAFIVRNITVYDENGEPSKFKENENGDLSIVYVGTQTLEDWTGTNLHLPGRAEPEQSKDALKYVLIINPLPCLSTTSFFIV